MENNFKKYRRVTFNICVYCGEYLMLNNKRKYCNAKCEKLFLEQRCNILGRRYLRRINRILNIYNKNQKRHFYYVSDIISKEELEDMVEMAEKNIDILIEKYK